MAPQIGFSGLAPRSRTHLCFTMVEGSNRRREGGDVSRGFRVPRATALAGPDWFLRCKSVPTLAKNALPFNFEQLRLSARQKGLRPLRYIDYHRIPRGCCRNGNPEPMTMRRHGHGNKYSAGGRRDRTLRFLFSTTFIAHNKGSGFPLRRE